MPTEHVRVPVRVMQSITTELAMRQMIDASPEKTDAVMAWATERRRARTAALVALNVAMSGAGRDVRVLSPFDEMLAALALDYRVVIMETIAALACSDLVDDSTFTAAQFTTLVGTWTHKFNGFVHITDGGE